MLISRLRPYSRVGLAHTLLRSASVTPLPRFKSSKRVVKDSESDSQTPEPPRPPSAEEPPLAPPTTGGDVPTSSQASPSPAPAPTSLSLDFSPSESDASQKATTGAKSSKDSLSSIEKQRRTMSRIVIAVFGLGLFAGIVHLGRPWEDDEKVLRDKAALEAGRLKRTQMRMGELTDVFSKPQWPTLLPPPLPPPHQKPYTLLLSLDDLLITSVWDRKEGYRTAKRPGVDYFLAYLSQFYEVVLFTSQPHYTALPVIDALDRYHFYFTYHLFRESTKVHQSGANTRLVKDLSYLNRDLSKVVIIDTDPDHVHLQPENAIVLQKWKGDGKGEGKASDLVGLIPFLESIAFFAPDDVRPILKKYQGQDIAKAYAIHEAAEKKKFLEEWQSKGSPRPQGLSFSRLFGSSMPPDVPTNLKEPLTFLEQRRLQHQAAYKREQQYLNENKDVLERARQEDIDRQKEEQMAGSLLGWVNSLGGPPPDKADKKPAVAPLSSTSPSTSQ